MSAHHLLSSTRRFLLASLVTIACAHVYINEESLGSKGLANRETRSGDLFWGGDISMSIFLAIVERMMQYDEKHSIPPNCSQECTSRFTSALSVLSIITIDSDCETRILAGQNTSAATPRQPDRHIAQRPIPVLSTPHLMSIFRLSFLGRERVSHSAPAHHDSGSPVSSVDFWLC